jgi:beta-lactamase class A
MDIPHDVGAILAPLRGRTAFAARLLRRGATPDKRHAGEDDAAPGQEADLHVALNADEAFPAAGLAKLAVAVEFLRRADLGQFDLAERWDTPGAARVDGSGVSDYLDPATQLTLGDLCARMLIAGDNTAANVLLDLVGVGEVNESLSRMGLRQTKLTRRFMDVAVRDAWRDNVTSASDMVILLSLVQHNMLPGARWLRETLQAQRQGGDLTEGWLPPEARLAHKDGVLPDAAHDAGLLTGPRGAFAYCALTAEQEDIPAARYAIGGVVRLLWDAWLDDAQTPS